MHYLVLPSITVNVERPRAAFRTTSHHPPRPLTMLVSNLFLFVEIAFLFVVAYIIVTRAGAWAHAIGVGAAVEVVEEVVEEVVGRAHQVVEEVAEEVVGLAHQVVEEVVELAHQVAVERVARCASPFFFSLHFGGADSPQGKRRTRCRR